MELLNDEIKQALVDIVIYEPQYGNLTAREQSY